MSCEPCSAGWFPRLRKKSTRGWGVADYGLGAAGRGFMSIGPQKGYVNLYFMNGIDLPDPDGLLEGTGKNMRHVKIRRPEDLKNRSLHALVRQAARLGGKRRLKSRSEIRASRRLTEWIRQCGGQATFCILPRKA